MIRFIASFVEFLSWCKIVASPFIIGSALGGIFFLSQKGLPGMIVGALFSLTGLISGVLIANRVSRKMGATEFNARISASPDFNDLNKKR